MRQNQNNNNTTSQNYSTLLRVWLGTIAVIGFAGLVLASDIRAQLPDGASDSKQVFDGSGETSSVAVPTILEVAQTEAGNNSATVGDISAAPCKGLQPFNNLDELLYQFYINLESDCLFEMPAAELEKIWDIKILDKELAKPKNYYPLSENEFYNKPYKSEKDAFYVELVHYSDDEIDSLADYKSIFRLKMTKKYFEEHGTFFSDEKLPALLPKPRWEVFAGLPPCTFPFFSGIKYDKPACMAPFWISADHGRHIWIMNSGEIWVAKTRDLQNKNDRNIPPKSDSSQINASAGTAGDAESAPCRGLKPYENLDDLLYQIYINLDSDCLFKTPLDELEKAWDTKICHTLGYGYCELITTDFSRFFNKNHRFFNGKPYKTERDGFYIVASTRNNEPYAETGFTIVMTDEYYQRTDGHFYSFGVYPKILPGPQISFTGPAYHLRWSNSDMTLRMYLKHEGFRSIYAADSISVYK